MGNGCSAICGTYFLLWAHVFVVVIFRCIRPWTQFMYVFSNNRISIDTTHCLLALFFLDFPSSTSA